MYTSAFTRALTLGAVTLLTAQQAFAADVKSPYKAVGDIVVFQPSSNLDPELVPYAEASDFKIIYSQGGPGDIAVAQSGKNYYCNAVQLPTDFDPASARFVDNFVLFSGKAWQGCKPLDYPIDAEKFSALDFPFYSDGKVVLTVAGERIEGADAASFKTLARNQAKDKNHYYFMAGEDVILPYKRSASAFPPCYGWGNIDGTMYYQGQPRPDVDSESFTCFSFNTAADKHGFYAGGKTAQAVIPAGVNVRAIKPLTEEILSDGKYVWFVGIEATLLSGINAGKVRWEKTRTGNKITDGANSWECTSFKTNDDPTCNKL